MNYVCVSVNREVVNKENFYDRQEAINYFEILYGEKIYRERQQQKERLEQSIQKYNARIEKQLSLMQENENTNTTNNEDYNKLNILISRKEKKEEELRQCYENLYKEPVSFEEKFDTYKEELISENPQLMLHISGIYQNGNVFSVVEEKYYCMGTKIESTVGVCEAMKKIPPQWDCNRVFLYVVPEKSRKENMDNVKKAQREITSICNQILRNFHSGLVEIVEGRSFT